MKRTRWKMPPLLLLAALALCLMPMATAHASPMPDRPSVEGYVLAGTCMDGAWQTRHLVNLPDSCADELAAPITSRTMAGAKLHEVTSGRPLEARTIGKLPYKSEVRIVALRVLEADPGSPHVVWAKIDVDKTILREAVATETSAARRLAMLSVYMAVPTPSSLVADPNAPPRLRC